jgi:hypothetical protein
VGEGGKGREERGSLVVAFALGFLGGLLGLLGVLSLLGWLGSFVFRREDVGGVSILARDLSVALVVAVCITVRIVCIIMMAVRIGNGFEDEGLATL